MNSYNEKYCPDELLDVPRVQGSGRNMPALYDIAAKVAGMGVWAEFGVGIGTSAGHLLGRLAAKGVLYLFDSWRGIPDDWVLGKNHVAPKGSWCFTKPKISDPRAVFVDGWYRDTLPFAFKDQLALVNIDCDVYSSAREVLFGASDYIGPGTALVFDELLGYENYRDHEYRALCEWRNATGRNVRWLGKEKFGAVGVVQ